MEKRKLLFIKTGKDLFMIKDSMNKVVKASDIEGLTEVIDGCGKKCYEGYLKTDSNETNGDISEETAEGEENELNNVKETAATIKSSKKQK